MNSKGYFFTLTVLLLIIIVSLSFIALRNPGHSREASISSTRLNEINRFIFSVEDDAAVAVRIAAYRAFLALEEEIRVTNNYIPPDKLNDYVQELIINGSINGTPAKLLEISSMSEWFDKTIVLANYLGITYNLSDFNITISQDSPWSVNILFSARLLVTDPLTQSLWDRQLEVNSYMPINGFFDPLYTVETDQRYFQRIYPSPHTFPAQLDDHIDNHLYVASNLSPSYLQRLTGDTSLPNGFIGIESLVDVPTLASVGINLNRTVVDWKYFSTGSYTSCNVSSLPSWAIIDVDHLWLYNETC